MITPGYGWVTLTLGENPRSITKFDTLIQSIEDRVLEKVLYQSGSIIGNVGGGTDTLHTYTLGASILTSNDRAIRITGRGDFAANANTKTLAFQCGAASALTLNPTTTAPNNRLWKVEVTLVRNATNVQLLYVDTMLSGSPPIWESYLSQLPAQSETGTIELKFTGLSGASADNDIRQTYMLVELLRRG